MDAVSGSAVAVGVAAEASILSGGETRFFDNSDHLPSSEEGSGMNIRPFGELSELAGIEEEKGSESAFIGPCTKFSSLD